MTRVTLEKPLRLLLLITALLVFIGFAGCSLDLSGGEWTWPENTETFTYDIGPEGGKNGGKILCSGTPEEVAKNKKSYTAKFLKEELGL